MEEMGKEGAKKLNSSSLTMEEWNSRDDVIVLVESSEEVSVLTSITPTYHILLGV